MNDLTSLAESLNTARLTANSIEVTAPQSGIYGDVVQALMKTLTLLLNGSTLMVEMAYNSILNGNTVEQALGLVGRALEKEQMLQQQADNKITRVTSMRPGTHSQEAVTAVARSITVHLEHHGDQYDLAYSASCRNVGNDVAPLVLNALQTAGLLADQPQPR